MIKSNVRLVISIAKNYQGAGMNLQDLVQVFVNEKIIVKGKRRIFVFLLILLKLLTVKPRCVICRKDVEVL